MRKPTRINVTALLAALVVGSLGLVPGEAFSQQPRSTEGPSSKKTEEWSPDTVLASPSALERIKLPVKAKGIYITGRTVSNSKFSRLLKLVNETELNAMVIDIKEDEGRLTYQSAIPLVKEIKSDQTEFIPDLDDVMHTLQANNVYTIARVVCFKDPLLARKMPEWAMQKKTGGIWADRKGVAWIDPYRKEVWEYNVAIAKEAAKKGFREIQFDYVRFPDNGKRVDEEVNFYQQEGIAKDKLIAEFLAYAKKELEPYHVYVSADVFGLVPSVPDDMGIGQKWDLVSPTVDYLSPMMYPSHYANGTYGLRVPDAQPYETIFHSLQDAQRKDARLQRRRATPATIRPWYQDFTARWVKGHIVYGPREVTAQIKAGRALGVDQYLIWDASNTYSEAAWKKGNEQ